MEFVMSTLSRVLIITSNAISDDEIQIISDVFKSKLIANLQEKNSDLYHAVICFMEMNKDNFDIFFDAYGYEKDFFVVSCEGVENIREAYLLANLSTDNLLGIRNFSIMDEKFILGIHNVYNDLYNSLVNIDEDINSDEAQKDHLLMDKLIINRSTIMNEMDRLVEQARVYSTKLLVN
jgi:hypothetical protein